MGLSASQARLLSITSRLSDNELRSQTITNAKTSLANETTAASAAYMDALSATELNYSFYDADGTKISMPLTGAAMYEYSELKNQYGIINQHGQILVSERDATNYENSANIAEFLEKYGFENSFTQTTTTTTTTVDNEGYAEAMKDYQDELQKLQSGEPQPTDPIYRVPVENTEGYNYYDDFLWASACCYGSVMVYLTNKLGLGEVTEYDSKGNPVVTYRGDSYEYYDDVEIGKVLAAGKDMDEDIYTFPKQKECYCHVFTHLLELGDYTTTTGDPLSITLTYKDYEKEFKYTQWWINDSKLPDDTNERYERSGKLAKILSSDASPVLYVCGETGKDITQSSSDVEKLLSDYYFDENGVKQLKTIEQKIVDLNYANGNDMLTDQELYDSLQHFVQHDIKQCLTVSYDYDEEAYKKDHDDWQEKIDNLKEPDINDFTTTAEVTETTIDVEAESEEGQWYINLWHRMNGPSIYKVTLNGYDNGVHDPENDGTIEGDNVTSPTNGRTEGGRPLYKVLEDGLMNNAEWLQYALRNGTVTLERVDFTNPTEYGTGLDKYTWNSIQWTTAADITESQNEAAITKAEVEYEQALNDIQAKDKMFDNQLKILDTEHNALQTEYDSIKSIIEKTVERNLKLYS